MLAVDLEELRFILMLYARYPDDPLFMDAR